MIKIFPIKSETYETGSMITLNGLMKVHFKLYIHVSLILAYNKKAYWERQHWLQLFKNILNNCG